MDFIKLVLVGSQEKRLFPTIKYMELRALRQHEFTTDSNFDVPEVQVLYVSRNKKGEHHFSIKVSDQNSIQYQECRIFIWKALSIFWMLLKDDKADETARAGIRVLVYPRCECSNAFAAIKDLIAAKIAPLTNVEKRPTSSMKSKSTREILLRQPSQAVIPTTKVKQGLHPDYW